MTGSYDVLTLVTAGVVAIFALVITFGSAGVVWHYARALRADPGRQGLLLWHVIAVAGGTSLTWGMLLLGQLNILGWVVTLLWLRLVGYAAAGFVICLSLLLIAKVQNRRVQTSTTETTIRTTKTVIDGNATAPSNRETGGCPCPGTAHAAPAGLPGQGPSEASP